MAELLLDRSFVEMLIAQTRAVHGKVDAPEGSGASNAADDDGPGLLQEQPNDLTREEVRSEIAGLSPDEKAELVALMWLGRGDAPAEEWESLVTQARERAAAPAQEYLLGEPMVSEFWAEGLVSLDEGSEAA